MAKRYVAIWFRTLKTDWFCRRQPALREQPFVLTVNDHGRNIISEVNSVAGAQGIYRGMVLADARAIIPSLQVMDDDTGLAEKILKAWANWLIRYTPVVAIDPPEGLLLDVSGCPHLWGGEEPYLLSLVSRIKAWGYDIRASISDTIGCAWAQTRFGNYITNIEKGQQLNALLYLPAAALRLEEEIVHRLQKLGLRKIKDFVSMPRTVLRRRFGDSIIRRLDQALGNVEEIIEPVHPPEPYQERLPCLEPIVNATGIEIALTQLLQSLCKKLKEEEKGLRSAVLKCYRIDGEVQVLEIGTHRPSHNPQHLFKLFENSISGIEPALGIELFTLDAPRVEEVNALQSALWQKTGGLENIALSELLDRLSVRIGAQSISRYLADEHYWPERSVKRAGSLVQESDSAWKTERPRPFQLLKDPELIEVTAPIPDYPPMLFRYRGKLHTVKKADGPERIEQEWWLQQGLHRDYYYVEDEEGKRYWLFRAGHYDEQKKPQWFIHGFFA